MIFHTVSIVYNDSFWIALFEMNDESGYSVAREIIGTSEPTGSDLFLFFSRLDYNLLKYTSPSLVDFTVDRLHSISYKKMQKKIKKEERCQVYKCIFTRAQSKLKKQLMENKKDRKKEHKIVKMEAEEYKFRMKQQKRKEKHKGH